MWGVVLRCRYFDPRSRGSRSDGVRASERAPGDHPGAGQPAQQLHREGTCSAAASHFQGTQTASLEQGFCDVWKQQRQVHYPGAPLTNTVVSALEGVENLALGFNSDICEMGLL